MNILGLITAKVDSARVPHKNFQSIAGKPLYKWTTEFLNENQDCFTALAFSSDKPERFDVPHNIQKIQRPPDLCKESAVHKDVVIHALDCMEYALNKEFDYIILFQPTNPFRNTMDLVRLIALTEEARPADSYMYYIDDNLKSEYVLGVSMDSCCNPMIKSGNMYLYGVPYLLGQIPDQEIITMEIPKWRGYNINTREDFHVAEALYEANNA